MLKPDPAHPDQPQPPTSDLRPPPVDPGVASRCFRSATRTSHTDSAYGTTLADLDGDEILDAVAIESLFEHAIRVWRGDRDGRFHAASTLAYDGGGLNFALLDHDRDGQLDLATSDHDRATVTLWMGNGDGSFTRGAAHKTSRHPLGIDAVDLDADGFTDLVVGHYFHLEVLRGGKGGKLKPTPWLKLVKQPDKPRTLLTPEDIVAVDLTGDRVLDLVVPKGDVTSLEVWAGRKRGGFARAANVTVCDAPAQTLVGDVDEDGNLDIILVCGRTHLELYAGDGKGGLTGRGPVGPADTSANAALVDLTGDGHLDLIAPTIPGGLFDDDNLDATGVLTVHAGDGKGNFRELDARALDGLQHRVVAVTDIDGDERLDVVHECFGQRPGAHLGVLFGTGCPG